MRMMLVSLMTGALLTGAMAAGAMAMPLAQMPSGHSALTLVRDGCGPYGHRTRSGYCIPDRPPGYLGPLPLFQPSAPFVYGGGPRCFIRDTYNGPRRICRY